MLDDRGAPRGPEPPRIAASPTVCDGRSGAPAVTARVAAFVCPEVERIGREVGFPLAVIAATSDPDRHAAHLTATWHAGWSPRTREDWVMPFDFGMLLSEDVHYRQVPFDRRWLGRFSLPDGVTLASGCLVVELPPGASAADLSAILRTGLADSAYDRVARRPDRVRQRYSTSRPAVVTPRYALVTPGDVDRLVAVDDLFAFRPADLAALAQAVAHARDALKVGIAMVCSRDEPGAAREDSHA